ncbi:ribonuclease P protein component 4 [Nanoarchaeota archaeon]
MKRIHKKKPLKIRETALERIKELFKQADSRFSENPSLSNRYVTLARKISMKYKIKLPRELKRKFCKGCHKYWKPGKTVRIRLLKGRKVYYCELCKKFTRIPYK